MDVLADENKQYATVEYWDKRYQTESEKVNTYDWFKKWADLKDSISEYLQADHEILHLGCGNSSLSEDMYEDGFKHQANVDYSLPCIEAMAKRCEEKCPEIRWIHGDIFQLSPDVFAEPQFDVALDKGTMDAFLTTRTQEDDPWNPSERIRSVARNYLTQVAAVLKPGGRFIHVTWEQPQFRRQLLEVLPDQIVVDKVKKVGDGWEYFIYICTKRQDSRSEQSGSRW
ncbi:S-adenosyl-L-methionine-dependent methyltransferase [Polychytrium aggregatum]|uniref:S-adenosyl-L-methionine-dependent methyltransferase n=1 Tax=Polychytrium aggregatum TaxID=110093 RepID=UPI0022FE824A|nr:S-adenosyl-L-methionine-dependent methyltransferase [Polychytrium aggregatum]KAI9193583.1 S-adenosyl-L-methionine-dependent methyltransferase [Polychytrium aggregatum]